MATGAVLLDILVVLVAAKLAAEVAERVGMPAVVGEITAGVIVGPSLLGLVEEGAVLAVLAELGAILLLLEVGMHLDLADLAAVGRTSVLVAVVGVVVPFALGTGAASALGHGGHTGIFVGAALTATSVGITARVLADLRALATPEARTVLGAAVADDVLGLLVLTVVVRLATGGTVDAGTIALIAATAGAFLVLAVALSLRLVPPAVDRVASLARSPGTLLGLTLAFALGLAELADAARLAPIIGAFVAGLALGRAPAAAPVRRDLGAVGHLLVPVFFLEIGIRADVDAFTRPEVLGLAGALLVVAVIGKVVAGLGVTGAGRDKLLVGLGMLPRGEVGLIFAAIGLREGILSDDLYAALLAVVLVTTLVTPPLLRWRVTARERVATGAGALPARPTAPPGGWLRVEDETVELTAEPPPDVALGLALDAALLVRTARPGPELVDWLGQAAHQPLRWDTSATARFFAVLREGNARSWRFLDTTGVLVQALPELEAAVRRRHEDPFELEPLHANRWALVDRLRDLATTAPDVAAQYRALEHPEWLLLGALLLDAATSGPDAVVGSRHLVQRLGLGAAAEQEVAMLVGERDLFLGAAQRPDGLAERRVLALAVHLDRPERARALYILSRAQDELDLVAKDRLQRLLEMLLDVLARPDLTGRQTRAMLDRRRGEAARVAAALDGSPEGVGTERAERARNAPVGHLLTHPPAEVAHHAALLEPPLERGEVRVAVRAADGRQWRVDVARRDRPGLLARVTGVLTDLDLDIVEASAATWDDGAAVETFLVRAQPPDATVLTDAVRAALDVPPTAPAIADAQLSFDSHASPWYTLCTVEAADRPGLLHAVATAAAAVEADIHTAWARTKDTTATSQLELTDRTGQKLDDATQAALVEALKGGVTPRRSRERGWSRSRNNRGTARKPARRTVLATWSDSS